jgi:hypothetical protein
MKTTWKWYGIKTLQRTEPTGRPIGKDKYFSPSMTLVEERVVLVKARSFEEAIKKGEAEAREYARQTRHRNPYGQAVRSRYLGYCDAYLVDDRPIEGTEIYSSTEVVLRGLSDRSILQRVIGRKETPRTNRSRRNILDVVFAAPAPGVPLTQKELAFVERYQTLRRRSDA